MVEIFNKILLIPFGVPLHKNSVFLNTTNGLEVVVLIVDTGLYFVSITKYPE